MPAAKNESHTLQAVALSTIRFIERAVSALDKADALDPSFRRYFRYPSWRHIEPESVHECTGLILELEEMAKKREHQPMQRTELPLAVDARYPIFRETLEVFPIYNEAIAHECHRPVVLPNQIPGLLYLLKIPGCSEGLDVEHHGFGYHFHYGKVKSQSIVRTSLLLTFNPHDQALPKPRKTPPKKLPLYSEQHAEGKSKPINVEAIGSNKRLPIYWVCVSATEKRAIKDFKVPGNKATVFHSG